MDWRGSRKENGKALRQVAAVLLSLADLAERSCAMPLPLRLLLLWLLRHGERRIGDRVAALTGMPACELYPLAECFADDSAAGALLLAARFRALAAFLTALAAEAFALAETAGTRIVEVLAAPLAVLCPVLGAVGRLDSS